jgi:hypothetical protein
MNRNVRLILTAFACTLLYASVFLLTGCGEDNRKETTALKRAEIAECRIESKEAVKELWTECLRAVSNPSGDVLVELVDSCHHNAVEIICGK